MIVVIGSVITKPDTHEEMLALSIEHCKRSRAEEGCFVHTVHTDCENPSKLVFVEYWENKKALEAHFKVPKARDFARALYKLGAEPPVMEVYDAEEMPVTI